MTDNEIIKANAILILEQKKEIEELKTILNNIARELPVEYDELEGVEELPRLARYWVAEAKSLQEKRENLSKELRDLLYKFRA
jgi:hypothetical protein